MTDSDDFSSRDRIADITINIAIRLSILFLIIYICFFVLSPFMSILLWAAILATTLYPVYQWLTKLFGGRGGLASTLIVLVGLAITLGPVSLLAAGTIDGLHVLEASLAEGSIKLPPPPDSVAEWPFIGKQLSSFWWLASTNLQSALVEVKPQAEALGQNLLAATAGTGVAILKFSVSVVIAGVLFGAGNLLGDFLRSLETRILPEHHGQFVTLAHTTVQNVARGVIGVALLQTVLASIGYLATDYPFGLFITILVMVLSLLNLGPTVPVFLSIIYGWSFMDTLPAVLFTIYMIPVGVLDNFRPIIVARGLPVPISIMFMGVIGGALTGGLLGLFIGPVVLVVGYQLLIAWMAGGDSASVTADPQEGDGS